MFGTLFPILAVLASIFAGMLVVRHSGLKAFAGLDRALRGGILPAGSAGSGLAGVLAGILLIIPGFLSDLLAVLLLIPAARRFAAGFIKRRAIFVQKSSVYRTHSSHGATIIEGEAIEISGDLPRRREELGSPWQR